MCRLQLLLVLASAVILSSESRGTHYHILVSQIEDSPNLEGQALVFLSLRNRVAQLYPQALGSLFVASYDSHGYGGGIRPRLHTGTYQYVP
jgi:flagellar basal body P-ring protein FlgI